MEWNLNYCEDCLVGTSLPQCPQCGKHGLRKATGNDWCFLTKREAMWNQPLKDFLTDNGVFFVAQPASSGLSVYGLASAEMEKFFVRAVDLERATDLVRDYLSPDVTFLEEDGRIWEPGDEIVI